MTINLGCAKQAKVKCRKVAKGRRPGGGRKVAITYRCKPTTVPVPPVVVRQQHAIMQVSVYIGVRLTYCSL